MRYLSLLLLAAAALSVGASSSWAAERKPLNEVNIDTLIKESQKQISVEGIGLAWVIPAEFWIAAQGNQPIGEQEMAVYEALKPYFVLAVVRGDVSPTGMSFAFHPEPKIFASTSVEFHDTQGRIFPMQLKRRAAGDAQLMVDMLRPILRSLFGQIGDNMHLYILPRAIGENREASVYKTGSLVVSFDALGKQPAEELRIQFPFDSLYVARQCAKCEREAHISWHFCPWCGQEFPE